MSNKLPARLNGKIKEDESFAPFGNCSSGKDIFCMPVLYCKEAESLNVFADTAVTIIQQAASNCSRSFMYDM